MTGSDATIARTANAADRLITELGAAAVPAVTLPTGGGSVRGVGEKFSANPTTGTGSLTIPLPVSPARSGSGPQLNLAYDSGAPLGVFGLGWGVAAPAITRKTDKGVPRYDDPAETDTFLLSGAEDLVPILDEKGTPRSVPRRASGVDYVVVTYRPRIEGTYSRIERWTAVSGETHWRSISRDNVTTLYGVDAASRIADPADPAGRVFSWLVSSTVDARGNAIAYHYVSEDAVGVDPGRAHEFHRTDTDRTANRYLKSITYGNRISGADPAHSLANGWMFELVFDYGDHDEAAPSPRPQRTWPVRHDPFSSYRSGFEIRTYRLCRRILMFHHFPDEPEVGADCLVRSMRLEYAATRGVPDDRLLGHPEGALLASVTISGHRSSDQGYVSRDLPRLALEYSTAAPDDTVHEVDPENLPAGVDDGAYQWVDLDGFGIAGVLAAQAGALYYRRGDGDGQLGPVQALPSQPSVPLGPRAGRLLDLDGDGQLDLVSIGGAAPGFFERRDGAWAPHRPFRTLPVLDWDDLDVRFADVSGDGLADVLVTQRDSVVWFPSLGPDGFGPGVRVPIATDEDAGPRLVFADGSQSLYLADMTGDGLPDLVRVRNGDVRYWPSCGYGRFGPYVVMDNAPRCDGPDTFDQRRVRLADVAGSGPADLIYLGIDGVRVHTNLMGNGFAGPVVVPAFPPVDDVANVAVTDLLGTGTACLVWSSPLPTAAGRRLRYVDLMGAKPNLLVRVDNNLGGATEVTYASSTTFALRARADGDPWITSLPFPVHVVEHVAVFDRIARTRFVTRYCYRDGFFDGVEREFRGFGMVEQLDTEDFAALADSDVQPTDANEDASHRLPPVRTRTWFHTGAYRGREQLARQFATHYYPPPDLAIPEALAWLLDDTPLPADLPEDHVREACRALKGQVLRQEIYADDGSPAARQPYTVVEHSYTVRVLQAPTAQRNGVHAVDPRETITATCERDPEDARVAHEVVLDVDAFGNVLHSLEIAYGRGTPDLSLPDRTRNAQGTTLVTETRSAVTALFDEPDGYRIPVTYDVAVHQLSGASSDPAAPLDVDGARPRIDPAALDILRGGPLPAGLRRTLVARSRVRFTADDLGGALAWGVVQPRGLVHETFRLARPDALVAEVFGTRVDSAQLAAAGYSADDGGWWLPSGTVAYAPAGTPDVDRAVYAAAHFFLPRRFTDPFGATTEVDYDVHDTVPVRTVDPVRNTTTATINYRVLAAESVVDANGNRTAVAFDTLGLVTATAIMGKAGDDTGDRLPAVDPDPTATQLELFWADPDAHAADLLGEATTRVLYDIDAFAASDTAHVRAPGVATIARERHVVDGDHSPLRVTFSYVDGAGREIQHKVPAEPDAGRRWVADGWTVLNNKGHPVRKYEPFFTASPDFEFAVTVGVSPTLFYDPLGRLVTTLYPNHTYDKVVMGSAWQQRTWDVNDTAALPGPAGPGDPMDDPDVSPRLIAVPSARFRPSWYSARASGALGEAERVAAERTATHTGTPMTVVLDPLGRTILTVGHNVTPDPAGPVTTQHHTHTVLDVLGNQLALLDDAPGGGERAVARFRFDLAGRVLLEEGLDTAARRTFADVAGRPVATWEVVDDAGGERQHAFGYDSLRRPITVTLTAGGATALVQRTTYGEGSPDDQRHNVRARVLRSDDGAGTNTFAYDVQGNQTTAARTFTAAYRDTVDWSTIPTLTSETWTSQNHHDALGRRYLVVNPDGSQIQHDFDRAGRVTMVRATLVAGGAPTTLVEQIRYDAKGQRTLVEHGNGTLTSLTYDPETFRLATRSTLREAGHPDDDPIPPDTRRGVQDLRHTYDPAGNVIRIEDRAQPRVYTLNTLVDARLDYGYDALYRLVVAEGREHLGTAAGGLVTPTPWSATDAPRVNPSDRQALGRYRETFGYDLAGNLELIHHEGLTDPALGGWTRTFTHDEPSLLEPGRSGNRLRSSTTSHGGDVTEIYHHDAQGCADVLPPLQLLRWDHRNRLQATSTQRVGPGLVPETTYYTYDDTGRRARLVTDGQAPDPAAARAREEHLYLGEFEVHRAYDVNGGISLQRTTVHATDGETTAVLIETRTDAAAAADPDRQLLRYQYTDHLGSTAVELDAAGDFVSYEQYYAYGCTALTFWRAGTPPKRYRFTGQERDATGLYYHGARYYAPWLGRWASADPIGTRAGPNGYSYAQCSPSARVDPKGTRDATPEEQKTLNHFEKLRDTENERYSRLWPVAKAWQTVFNSGSAGRARTAELNRRFMAAAIHRAAPGEPLAYGGSGTELYYDKAGHVMDTLPTIPMYLTQREAAISQLASGLEALAFSPLSGVGNLIADAAGASAETKQAVLQGGAELWGAVLATGSVVDARAANSAGYSFGPTTSDKTPYSNTEVRQWNDNAEQALGELQQTSSFQAQPLESQAKQSNTIRRSITGEARSMMESGGVVTEPIPGLEPWVGKSLSERDADVYGPGGRTFENVYNRAASRLEKSGGAASPEQIFQEIIKGSTKPNQSVNDYLKIKR